jgi:hypothetical protein
MCGRGRGRGEHGHTREHENRPPDEHPCEMTPEAHGDRPYNELLWVELNVVVLLRVAPLAAARGGAGPA